MKQQIKYVRPQLHSFCLSKQNVLMKSQDNFVDPWGDWGNLLNDMGGRAVQQAPNRNNVDGVEDIWGAD